MTQGYKANSLIFVDKNNNVSITSLVTMLLIEY